MYLHQLLENLLTYVQCIFWSAEWNPRGVPDYYECEVIENDAPVPKHIPLPTEFHKMLEALTSQSENHTPAASSREYIYIYIFSLY